MNPCSGPEDKGKSVCPWGAGTSSCSSPREAQSSSVSLHLLSPTFSKWLFFSLREIRNLFFLIKTTNHMVVGHVRLEHELHRSSNRPCGGNPCPAALSQHLTPLHSPLQGQTAAVPGLCRSRRECALVFLSVPLASVYLGGKRGHMCSLWKSRPVLLYSFFFFLMLSGVCGHVFKCFLHFKRI